MRIVNSALVFIVYGLIYQYKDLSLNDYDYNGLYKSENVFLSRKSIRSVKYTLWITESKKGWFYEQLLGILKQGSKTT